MLVQITFFVTITIFQNKKYLVKKTDLKKIYVVAIPFDV